MARVDLSLLRFKYKDKGFLFQVIKPSNPCEYLNSAKYGPVRYDPMRAIKVSMQEYSASIVKDKQRNICMQGKVFSKAPVKKIHDIVARAFYQHDQVTRVVMGKTRQPVSLMCILYVMNFCHIPWELAE